MLDEGEDIGMNLKRLLFGKRLIVLIGVLLTMAAAPVGILTFQQYMDAEATSGDGQNIDMPDLPSSAIGDAPSNAELEDLQTIADQKGITLQDAIDHYAWHDNFALAVSKIREVAPDAFTGAEIIDDTNAWVAFVGPAPQAASAFLNTFNSSHSDVSVEVRTGATFTEVELENGIKAAHYAVMEESEVLDASTSFDVSTSKITTVVVLEDTTPDSVLSDLRAIAKAGLTTATRADILNGITVSVSKSTQPILGVSEDASHHYGGEALVPTCTTGFGTKTGAGDRGISTAGHCQNSQTDDDDDLTFEEEHEGGYGDFQWHSGPDTHSDDFYSGSNTETEVYKRDVTDIGSPVVGQTLCRNGKMSHKDCQQVRKLNYCVGVVCSLVQMGEHLSTGGDSGGPVFYGGKAYGIHKGMVWDPPPFPREVFSRADRMMDAIDVRVTTD